MDRSRLLFVALVVSIALLVPSGAWPYDPTGVDRSEEMNGIELAPADGPNGEYAVVNSDKEIEILIGEVNPYVDTDGASQGSVSTIPHIFTITNTGSTAVSAWITDDVDALRYIRGDSEYESVEGRTNRVTIGPNETASIGLYIDVRDEISVERADSFTVHASRIETDRPATERSVAGGRERSSTASPSASEKIITTSLPVSDGAATAETEAPPTSAGRDSQTATPTGRETDTPTRAERGISTPTPTVPAPSPASRRPPSGERNQSIAGGFGPVSSSAMGALIALLSLVVVLLAVLRHVRGES